MKSAIRRAGIGATVLFAAAAFAAPAYAAASSDLEVQIKGTTLAVGATEKNAVFTIANNGPDAVSDFGLVVDFSGLDDAKAQYEVTLGSCTPTGDVFDCVVPGPIEPGESWDFLLVLKRVGTQIGDAGQVTVTVDSGQDANPDNNSATVGVEVGDEEGVDLTAWAFDIYAVDDPADGPGSETPVEPGDETVLFVNVVNQGDIDSAIIKMQITLPPGVTFVGSEPDCDYTDGSTETECTYTGDAGKVLAGGTDYNRYYFNVKVAADVTAPSVIPGGVFTVENVPQQPQVDVPAIVGPSTKQVTRGEVQDIDPSDNTDEFSAYVADQGGSGGGLPLTGTNVTMIAVAGLGVIVVGGALFLITRRRRITG